MAHRYGFEFLHWKRILVGFLFLSLAFLQNASSKQPNVVVFLADDAGWGDYGINGNRQLSTPNIDRIAREGATLDRFYVCPVCSPTRAEWLTGRYHLRGGVVGVSTGQERLDLDEHTIADSFKAAGYSTGAFGKWHNGSQWPYHPIARGFDEYFGHTAGHWGEYFDPELEHNGTMGRYQGYIVDICTDRAIDFISQHHDRPFFCYVPFTTPHSPWAVPEDDWARFKDKPITQLGTIKDREVIDETRCALAMVENQDRNVGRVLQELERRGILDDTIVFYFSDNGPNTMRFNGQMKGKKGTTDEGGVRVPGLIRWPRKIPAGVVVPQIAGAIDLLPTLLSLASVERIGDKPLDGLDLSPLLTKTQDKTEVKDNWPARMIFSTWAGKTSVRTDQYRLDDKGLLYDMITDPGQTKDVSSDCPEIALALRQAVARWDAEMKAEAAKKKTATPSQVSRQRSQVDPRPIHVGFKEFPITILPARDGDPRGNVKRSSNAPNSSYFVNWTTPDDAVVWKVTVQNAGRYNVTIDYTCPVADAGSELELSFASSSLKGIVAPGWDPPLYDNQDTLPRPPAESKMKPFRTLSLGQIELPSGAGELRLRALKVRGDSVMDLRRITLTYIDE
ncbi:MAG TPA: N-acetylgalactosamine 6-sulfate sulfatase [Planctomycetaceae bacterium]|nr:N-acetylgalactosamine 6-sulfate sulfatase [Planctomycetaceae bacterium]